VRAWRGDDELDLGAPQQRALLAMLLLAAGRHITLDELVSGLWEDVQPHAAVGTVRTYVSRLRRCLELAGQHGIIRTVDAGYVISVGPSEFDLGTFERLTKAARAVRAGEDGKRKAADLLREALSLGQGVPLAGIPGPFAESQRTRISELLMAATEERLALDIELGAHAAAVAELQTLLARHPMRERLSELLMLALYRSGRQAEALAVFDGTRGRLVEDLGIDPGPAMRKMHQRILQNDETLVAPADPVRRPAAAPGAEPPSGAAAPAQLPADLMSFAGQRRELALLDSVLASAASGAGLAIAAIDGMAGSGKTALAVHWARGVAGRFPDGQLYANLRGFDPSGRPVPPGEVLRGFLHALGAAQNRVPDDLDAQSSMYRSLLNGRRVLVLLDNARDMEQVRPLLPGAPGCLVLVTSRNRLPALLAEHGARTVTLDFFSAEEARRTLALRLGTARIATEPQALEDIIDRCAGLPLALAVVAARAALYPGLPLREIASELRSASTRLDGLSIDGTAADVRAAFSWSYRMLSEPAKRLFRLLSVHDGLDFSRDTAANLAGLPRAEAWPLLAELTAARLLTETRPGRFAAHDLIRVYAAELSAAHDTMADRRAAAGRLLDYLLHSSYAAQSLLRPAFPAPAPGPALPGVAPEEPLDYQQALAWFVAERPVLESAVRSASRYGFPAHAWRLALTLPQFYRRRGYLHHWDATMRAALRATLDAADQAGEAHVRRSLADVCHLLGQHSEAIAELERAGQLPGQEDCPAGQGYLHTIFGAIFAQQAVDHEAAVHYQQAVTLYRAAGYRSGLAHALESLGGCYARQGRPGEATILTHDAIKMYRELDDRSGEGACWIRLGQSHHLLGEDEQAMACYRHAVAALRELGSRTDEARALIGLGESALSVGDYGRARESWETAVAILGQLGLPSVDFVQRKLRRLQTPSAALAARAAGPPAPVHRGTHSETAKLSSGSVHHARSARPAAPSSSSRSSRRNLVAISVRISSPAVKAAVRPSAGIRTCWRAVERSRSSILLASGTHATTWSKASGSKSASSLALSTLRMFLLSAAASPTPSSWAATMTDGSLTSPAPSNSASPVDNRARTAARKAARRAGTMLPKVAPSDITRVAPMAG
jgi:DNA-binding SARP family transcriptional activator/tetratricopeptide (TPR) repeat protein